jgi:PAS domain S-box-containing protein
MEQAVLSRSPASAPTGTSEISPARNQTLADLEAQVVALTRLHDLAMALSGPHDLQTALETILKIAAEFHRAAQGIIYLTDRYTGALEIRAKTQTAGIFGAGLDPRSESYRALARSAGFSSVYNAPIAGRSGAMVGVLSLHFTDSYEPCGKECQVAEACARQAANAIEIIGAQEASREMDRRSREILNSLPVAVYSTDGEGRLTEYNEAAARLWGRSPEIGKDRWCGSAVMYWPDGSSLPLDQCPMAMAIQQKRALPAMEAVVERPDGTRRDVLAQPKPLFDGAGNLTGAINVLVDITEDKQSRRILRESEERLRALVDLMPAAVYTSDQNGRLTLFNRKAVELWGREPKLNDPVKDVSGSSHTIPAGETIRQAEGIVQRPDGSRAIVSTNIDPFYDAAGRVGTINVVQDITRLKRIEEDLRQSRNSEQARRAELETLMLAAPAAIFIADDPECRQITGNPAACALLRAQPGDNLSKTPDGTSQPPEWTVYYNNQKLPTEDLPMRAASHTGKPTSYQELEFRFPDGTSTWVYGNAAPVLDESGAVRAVIATFVDITRLKEAARNLAESEERFRNMADHSPVMVRVRDTLGQCLYMNQRWLELTGQTPEQSLGFGWLAAVHPEDRAIVQEAFHRSAGARERFRLEYRIRRHDGAWRWVLDASAPRFSPGGEFLGYVGSIIDITERRDMEESLRQANADLKEFTYAAAHDLQEPLRNMVIYGELLAESLGALDEDPQRFLNFTLEGAKRMQTLVADLLAYTHLSNNAVEPSEVDTGKVVAEVVQSLQPMIEETQASVELGSLPAVRGHATRLAQLFSNLITNAIRYRNPAVAPRIQITCERGPAEWLFAVRDNGIGINPAYHQQIFGVFKRLHGRSISGTGIGLAICRRVVEQHGGRIWVTSAGEGHGSTFHFALPIVEANS